MSFIENENEYWLEVEDDDPDDSVIYPGIQISEYDGRKKIVISMYYNWYDE